MCMAFITENKIDDIKYFIFTFIIRSIRPFGRVPAQNETKFVWKDGFRTGMCWCWWWWWWWCELFVEVEVADDDNGKMCHNSIQNKNHIGFLCNWSSLDPQETLKTLTTSLGFFSVILIISFFRSWITQTPNAY